MTTMTIFLSDAMQTFVEEMNQKGYLSASEYFHALLQERQWQRAQERFDALILEGVQSGPGIRVTPEFWDNLARQCLSSSTIT